MNLKISKEPIEKIVIKKLETGLNIMYGRRNENDNKILKILSNEIAPSSSNFI